MSSTNRANYKRYILIFFLLMLLVILGCSLIWLASQLPQLMSDKFGPGAPSLSLKDQLFTSLKLLLYEDDLYAPLENLQEPRWFTVQMGQSGREIAQRLKSEGLIVNEDAFEVFLIYSGLDTRIQAGDFLIENGMNAVDIALQFQDATPQNAVFVILPGWRIEEIAESLPNTGLGISPDDFVKFSKNTTAEALPQNWQTFNSLEGYLLPDTYRLSRDASLQEVTWEILNNFDSQVNQKLEGVFLSNGIRLEDAMIIASLVEREAILDDEKPIIASVFLNRMANGMKLESDPTVQYAIGFYSAQATWWKNPLSVNDLTIDSPFNTYLVSGLPPTPICNPGLISINAVAYPAKTDYLYFRAACDNSGRHNFSKTYEEHLSHACSD